MRGYNKFYTLSHLMLDNYGDEQHLRTPDGIVSCRISDDGYSVHITRMLTVVEKAGEKEAEDE